MNKDFDLFLSEYLTNNDFIEMYNSLHDKEILIDPDDPYRSIVNVSFNLSVELLRKYHEWLFTDWFLYNST